MSTSGVVNFNITRDQIITQALRNCGSLGEGETATSIQITENAFALNVVLLALQAKGMPLWEITQYKLPYQNGVNSYTIGLGGVLNAIPPVKVLQAWNRTNDGTNTQSDSPDIIVARFDYNLLGAKNSPGTPNQIWYDPPRAIGGSNEPFGTITCYPTPDSNAASTVKLVFTGQKMVENMIAANDTLDFPGYWFSAVCWSLSRQICRPQGVPLAESAMIAKEAQFWVDEALSFGTEEGSLRIQPQPSWNWESYD